MEELKVERAQDVFAPFWGGWYVSTQWGKTPGNHGFETKGFPKNCGSFLVDVESKSGR